MSEFKVTGNINHNGKSFVAGDTLELEAEQAAQLIEAGVLEDPNGEKPASRKPSVRADKPKADKVSVGGAAMETGEPSLDGRGDQNGQDNAKDVTPKLEDMSRNDLRDLAVKEGIPAEEVNGAFTSKATIIGLIEQKRASASEEKGAGDDPSANL
jgi:hypothetical protein